MKKYLLVADGFIISDPLTLDQIVETFGTIKKLESCGILLREAAPSDKGVEHDH